MGPATEKSICFFTISSPGTKFHYYVMDLSLLHTPSLSPVAGPGTDLGCVCRQVASGQGSHQAGAWRRGRRPRQALPKTEAGSGSLQKSRTRFSPVFIERGQKILNEHVFSSAQITQIAYF